MSRILKAYRTRFYQLLRQVGARRVDKGVEWLVGKASALSACEKLSHAGALTRITEELESKPRFRSPNRQALRKPADISFFCDAGLGGLARWLRAAGYQAYWEQDIPDNLLLKKAAEKRAAILTTDSMLMERRVLRDRVIAAFWLPPTLSIAEQLEKVFREFGLFAGAARCMACGGELEKAEKEQLRDRIPPKTYCWLDDYYLCRRCGKLFWHGTHWLRIIDRLGRLEKESSPPEQ
jgi:uncharacterized protein with PIN domain